MRKFNRRALFSSVFALAAGGALRPYARAPRLVMQHRYQEPGLDFPALRWDDLSGNGMHMYVIQHSQTNSNGWTRSTWVDENGVHHDTLTMTVSDDRRRAKDGPGTRRQIRCNAKGSFSGRMVG